MTVKTSPTLAGKALLTLFVMLCSACGSHEQNLPPAPRGDRAVLEKLATAYEKISADLLQGPRQQIPPERVRFVQFVFKEAGYGYGTTLIAFAGDELDPADPAQRDMAELLLLPTVNVTEEDLAKLYDGAELDAVIRLKTRF